MQPLSRSLGFAAVGALALTVASSPGFADELAQNLGPVGPNEPILTTVGSKRVIAFYVPGNGKCGINVVVWDRSDASGNSLPVFGSAESASDGAHRQHRDSKSINLQSGQYAETLALVDPHQAICRWNAINLRPSDVRQCNLNHNPLTVQSAGTFRRNGRGPEFAMWQKPQRILPIGENLIRLKMVLGRCQEGDSQCNRLVET